MTDSKEVIAYVIAHLAGYVVSLVISQMVVVPAMLAYGGFSSTLLRYGVFFLLFIVVQIAVFLLFLALRGRRRPS